MRILPSVRRRGFTLIELLITMVVIGLISLISFNKTQQTMTKWRVTRAAQATGEELQAAFAIVGRNRKPVTITLDKTKMELRITNRAGNVVYRKRNIGLTSAYRLDAADVTASKLSLEVYPPGLAADSLSFEISRQGKYRRIRMLRGGLVQICSNKATLNAICVPA
jgi:prepilin-type N-terminal cleavage/methylation domain-containing protein